MDIQSGRSMSSGRSIPRLTIFTPPYRIMMSAAATWAAIFFLEVEPLHIIQNTEDNDHRGGDDQGPQKLIRRGLKQDRNKGSQHHGHPPAPGDGRSVDLALVRQVHNIQPQRQPPADGDKRNGEEG